MDYKQKYREETNKEPYGDVEDKNNFTLDYVKWLEKQLALCNVVGRSEQLFIFYKELQKAGRLYNDNLSEDIMKREIDWFVKNK